MTYDRLSDYKIAINFGDTLSLIYKAKMAELNEDLKEAYALIDRLQIPQVPEFHRYFARASMPHWAQQRFTAIEHIQKIRGIYKKMKNSHPQELLDIQKAKSIPIKSLYAFQNVKKNMVSCPFHIDNSPSMKININNTVKCFSCGFFGDAIELIMKTDQINFKQAVEYLNKM